MAQATATTDHDEIRRWVEERGGRPARVAGTNILRIDFPDADDREENLEEISWDEWLRTFDESDVAFLHQDEPDSRFNKLVSRDST
jgi:hypothetical protein